MIKIILKESPPLSVSRVGGFSPNETPFAVKWWDHVAVLSLRSTPVALIFRPVSGDTVFKIFPKYFRASGGAS